MTAAIVILPMLLDPGLASAQTPPASTTDPAAPSRQAPNPSSADEQLVLMNKQLDAINQLILQNQRGVIVYPSSFALPGPINCQSSCQATVTGICSTLRYPKAYFYPALVTSQVVGTFVNGVCYGP